MDPGSEQNLRLKQNVTGGAGTSPLGRAIFKNVASSLLPRIESPANFGTRVSDRGRAIGPISRIGPMKQVRT